MSAAIEEPAHGIVGTSHRRVDALEKVTGRATYITDLGIAGAAHAKVWRSPVAHARIRRIDTAAARACSGVLAVVTAADLTFCELFFGPAYKDQPMLAVDRVRYAGEPVAAVVAATEAEAQAALARIEVEFDELPAVTTLEEALAPGAPVLHERLRLAGQFRDLASLKPTPGTNICHHFHYERGDVGAGFAEADVVLEDVFRFPMIHHYSMEPHAAMASVTPEGIIVWGSTQHPFPVRKELADIFRVPLNQVQVIVPHLGGAFGNKSYTKIEPLAVALARIVGRPVRLGLTTEEAFKLVRRAAARVRMKTGVRRDGAIVAREVEVHFQIGAYADVGPRVAQKAGLTAAGPYRVPNLKIDTYAVYSNTVCTAAFRGYGVPQIAWGYESQMDMLADRLGMDPLELRCRNFLSKGANYIEGDLPIDADFEGDLRKAAAAIGWPPPRRGFRVTGHESEPATSNSQLVTPRLRRGKGLACVIKAPLAPSVSSALVRMHADGSVTILTGTVEFGQGARTVMSQIVAEELGVPLQWVRVGRPEMGMSPYDQATSASRSTTLMGLAIQNAARDVRDQFAEIASGQLKTEPGSLRLHRGTVAGRGADPVAYADVIARHFGMPGGELIGRGTYRGERGQAPLGGVAPFWEVSMAAAEVEVDEETGQVRLVRYVSVADVGKAINPLQCEAQEEGGSMMGIGHTFFEEMIYEGGQLLNPSLVDYRIPNMEDLPEELLSILVENGDGPGPYGAKGIGESGLMPTSPAIANAIANAIGVRIKELPLTPERVLRAIQAASRRVSGVGGQGSGTGNEAR
jgi:CO/xanthine dehydrogenase Mo-binding subunit